MRIIYTSDRRLETLEALISGIFVAELCLRAFAFDPQSLLSCVQLFDAAVVCGSFALAVLSVNNPFLAGRSARCASHPAGPCMRSSGIINRASLLVVLHVTGCCFSFAAGLA